MWYLFFWDILSFLLFFFVFFCFFLFIFVYFCLFLFMFVYFCLWLFMFVYVCLFLFIFVYFCLFLFAAPLASSLLKVCYQLIFIIQASSSTGSPMLKKTEIGLILKIHFMMTTKVNAIEIDKAKIMLPIPQKLYVTKICKQQMTNEKYYCFGIRGFQ